MSRHFVGGDITSVASDLVIWLPVITGCAGVPDRDVVDARETIIMIIVPLVWLGDCLPRLLFPGGGAGGTPLA